MKRLINRDGTKFVTAERLGSGLLAVVYAAKNNATGECVAAKLPAPNLPSDQFKRFEEEYDLLTSLREHTLSVPMAWWGRDEERDQKILLLEMAPDDKLNDQLQMVDGWQREELSLKAAVQYASLLRHLHTAGHTCADRKMGDLRWDPSGEGQLMVLDWNAVRDQNERGVREDINIFAALWYQLLTDRYAGSDLRLLDDYAWKDGEVSIGTRTILLQAFSSGYTNAAELEKDLRGWLAIAQQSGERLHQLGIESLSKAKVADTAALTRSKTIRDQKFTTGTDIPELDLKEEYDALRYLDIARRKESGAEDDYQNAAKLFQEQGDRLVANVALAFEITQYEFAEQVINWVDSTLRQVEQLPTVTARLRLRAKRWQLLYHIGLTAIDKTEVSLRHERKTLADAVRQLDMAESVDNQKQMEEWRTAQTSFETLIGKIGRRSGSVPITDLLNLFVMETECRILFLSAEENKARGSYETAIDALNEIREKLVIEQKEKEALEYVTALRDDDAFKNFDDRIYDLRYRARTAVISQRLIADTADITVPATYVMQRLEEAQYFFANDLDAWKEIEEQNKLSAILLLAQIDIHQQTGQWQESIKDIDQLVRQYPSDEQVRKAVSLSIQKIIAYIKEMQSKQENDWIALEMLNSLGEIEQIWQSETPVSRLY